MKKFGSDFIIAGSLEVGGNCHSRLETSHWRCIPKKEDGVALSHLGTWKRLREKASSSWCSLIGQPLGGKTSSRTRARR